MTILESLMSMGFSKARAERALEATKDSFDVNSAIEWLLSHDEEEEVQEINKADTTSINAAASEPEMMDQSGPPTADATGDSPTNENDKEAEVKSIICDECGRKFLNDSQVEFHAVKSGHSSFSHSTEEITPLTEMEKKEKMEKLQILIKQRREENKEKERQQELDAEKSRRKIGQEITNAKQKFEEEEMKRMVDQKRKDKLEEKLARQRVLEQIERDKRDRRQKFGQASKDEEPITDRPTVPQYKAEPITKKEYDQCRIQVSLTNGTRLVKDFSPTELLEAVRVYIEQNRTDGTGPFSLMTNFPKKIFTQQDMKRTLIDLDLVPSVMLIVRAEARA